MSTATPSQPRKILRAESVVIFVAALILIVVLPLLNATGVVPNYTINLWGKYLSLAILALAVDLLWGYTGLLSLGLALFFSLGAYMHGMYLMRMIGELGQYKQPIPDFLVFLGWKELPAFWRPFDSFGFAMTMVFLIPGVIALIFGFLAFRSRIKGVSFSILTQALTYVGALMFFRNNSFMGGNNGFTDFRFILGYNLRDPAVQRALYVVTAIALLLVFFACRWLRRTKFGLVQQAIRDGENRTLFSGYATAHYKLLVFVLCACTAAVGGALYVPQVGIINPSDMWMDKSFEAVVWVAVGGRGTLFGPILGAICVNALKSWMTSGRTAAWWVMILGLICIFVVLFLPGGLVSLPERLRPLWKKLTAKKTAGDADPAAEAAVAPPKS